MKISNLKGNQTNFVRFPQLISHLQQFCLLHNYSGIYSCNSKYQFKFVIIFVRFRINVPSHDCRSTATCYVDVSTSVWCPLPSPHKIPPLHTPTPSPQKRPFTIDSRKGKSMDCSLPSPQGQTFSSIRFNVDIKSLAPIQLISCIAFSSSLANCGGCCSAARGHCTATDNDPTTCRSTAWHGSPTASWDDDTARSTTTTRDVPHGLKSNHDQASPTTFHFLTQLLDLNLFGTVFILN